MGKFERSDETTVRYTKKITISLGEHVFIAGATGTGKTVLAMLLLYPIKRLIVIDSKDSLVDWDLEEATNDTLKRVSDGISPVRVRVVLDSEAYEYIRQAYEAGNITIFVDEINALTPTANQARLDQSLINVLQRGRSRNISVWSGSQRPTNIPKIFMSEARHFFIFRLNLEGDRKTVSEFTNEETLRKPVDRYGFYYYTVIGDWSKYFPKVKIG